MSKPEASEAIFRSRRQKLLRRISGDAALFFSAEGKVFSRDLSYPYRYDSDFFYFTGIEEPSAALLLLGKQRGPRSILFLREKDAERERWVGPMLGLRKAKRNIRVDEVRNIENFESDLVALLKNTKGLHFTPGINRERDRFIWDLFRSPCGPQQNFPNEIKDARLLSADLRIKKGPNEIRHLRHVADITAHSIIALIRDFKSVTSELHAARVLESHFARLGANGLAFPTIVASGKNATCLHHSPSLSPLWRREMVLIDCGANFRGYSADITRTVPYSGKFTPEQREAHTVVYQALQAAIRRSKVGNTLLGIHQAALREITKGLIDLGILRGSLESNLEKKNYSPFFMHRTSHWLGLDAHDIAPREPNPKSTTFERKLQVGNVFTIEPGLYFSPTDKNTPAAFKGIGIRLEEDILITEKGCEILTRNVPVAADDVEQIMA